MEYTEYIPFINILNTVLTTKSEQHAYFCHNRDRGGVKTWQRLHYS